MEGKTQMNKFLRINIFAGLLFTGVFLAGCQESTPEQEMSRAVALARNNQWQKAAKIADNLARKNPSLAAAHVLRAVTSEHNGDRQSALDAARRALEIDPDNFVTRYTLARLYASDPARSSEAHTRLLKAWVKRLSDVQVQILLCNAAMEANSPRSISYLQNLALLPAFAESAALNNQFAVSFVRRRHYDKALQYFQYAAMLGKDDPEILLNVARFYDSCLQNRRFTNRIRKKDAIDMYQRFLKIAGDDSSGKVEAAARLSKLQNSR